MFRLVKIENGNTEIISADQSEAGRLLLLKMYVRDNASNGDEYTASDLDAIAEQGYENIGPYKVAVDEVSTLTDEEIVARGGGVCAHCHSDETDPEELSMEDGYVSRKINCLICNSETIEQYTLSGIES